MEENRININNIDKSKWVRYRFDKIAHNISERIDPTTTDLDVYIGLEHLDPETVHIKRKGSRDDVKGQKLKCYPGDIIFGKRRAYQRKAGIAKDDCFCSAHAMVLRANSDVIFPELFPFFIHSDVFMHRAIDISVGSLSPTINWRVLAKQEFLLPPKDQQKKIAELLWAMDEVIEKDLNLQVKLKVLYKSRMIDLLNGYNLSGDKVELPAGWVSKKIKELGIFSTSSVNKKIIKGEKEINLLNYMNVYSSIDKKIDKRTNFMRVTATENQSLKNQINRGDVIFTPSSETTDDIGHSCVVYEDLPETLYSYHLVRLRFIEEMDLDYKRFIFNNPKVLYNFSIRSKGVTRMTLSLNDFKETEVRIPPLDLQKTIAKELSDILENILMLDSKILASQSLQKSLINQIF